jgi:hypothetical protein
VNIPFYWLYYPMKERAKVVSLPCPRVPDVFAAEIQAAARPDKWVTGDRRVGDFVNYPNDWCVELSFVVHRFFLRHHSQFFLCFVLQ